MIPLTIPLNSHDPSEAAVRLFVDTWLQKPLDFQFAKRYLMAQTLRGRRFFVASVLCGMLILGIAVLVYWRVKFDLAFKEAWSVYAESRGGRFTDTSSDSFAIRGIQFGDTEEEVDRRMKGAAQSQKLEPAASDPGGTKFVKFYTFSYRPGLDYPIADKDYEFVSETFFVFFDEQGRAFQVKRRLFVRNDAEQTGTKVYDLIQNRELSHKQSKKHIASTIPE